MMPQNGHQQQPDAPRRTTLRRASRFTITPEGLIFDKRLTDRAIRLYLILDRLCAGREVTFPSRAMLAEMLPGSPSLSSVDRAVRDLCKAGWLAKERANRGDVNAYALLDGPADAPCAPVVMGADTPRHPRRDPSSPMTTPVVTHDDQEEEGIQERGEQTSPPAPPPGGREAKQARRTRCPEPFVVTEDLRAWAAREVPLVDTHAQTVLFTDHHVARGSTFLDWGRAWQKWMRQAENSGRVRPLSNRHLSSDGGDQEHRRAWG